MFSAVARRAKHLVSLENGIRLKMREETFHLLFAR